MIPRPQLLCNLINRGSFHGGQLAEFYGSPFGTLPGLPDATAWAERALALAENRGWIERGNYDPSRQQRFLGVGGFLGNVLTKLTPEHRSLVCFHWITKTARFLTPEDMWR